MRVAHEHVGHGLQLGLGVGGARRVRGAVEQQPLRLGRDRLFELLGHELEAVVLRAGHGNRRAFGQLHHVGIAHPIGRRDDHLVAGVERGQERVEQHLLAAGGGDDLLGRVVEIVLALELGRDRLLQRRRAAHIGVARLARIDRLLRGLAHVRRRVEIGLAGAEADHVLAGRLERARFHRHAHRGGGLDAGEALCEQGHGGSRG